MENKTIGEFLSGLLLLAGFALQIIGIYDESLLMRSPTYRYHLKLVKEHWFCVVYP